MNVLFACLACTRAHIEGHGSSEARNTTAPQEKSRNKGRKTCFVRNVDAEEGMGAAQLRKETKYSELLENINATHVRKASLWTLEIGARGLVGLSSHKTFVRLG